MTRIRFPLGRAAALVAFTLFCAAALLPLRVALGLFGFDALGLSARAVDGSIWLGRIEDARIGPVPVGSLHARLEPWRLFLGRARVAFDARGEDTEPHGALEVGRHVAGAHDLVAAVPFAAFIPGLPKGAELRLRGVSAVFEDGQCQRADGAISSNLLTVDANFVPGGSELVGTATCENGRLLLPLTGRHDSGDASLFLRIAGNGEYQFDVSVGAPDSALQIRLKAIGFAGDASALRLHGAGSL